MINYRFFYLLLISICRIQASDINYAALEAEEQTCPDCAENCPTDKKYYNDTFIDNWNEPCEEDVRGAGRAEYEQELWNIDYF